MFSENSGVWFSTLPTTILAVWMTWPFLSTRAVNSGMLSHTWKAPSSSGSQRQRSMLAISRCVSEPASAGLGGSLPFSTERVRLPITPSGVILFSRWKAAAASFSAGS